MVCLGRGPIFLLCVECPCSLSPRKLTCLTSSATFCFSRPSYCLDIQCPSLILISLSFHFFPLVFGLLSVPASNPSTECLISKNVSVLHVFLFHRFLSLVCRWLSFPCLFGDMRILKLFFTLCLWFFRVVGFGLFIHVSSFIRCHVTFG